MSQEKAAEVIRSFSSRCRECGELVDWIEMWSARDKKNFFAPATPGTFQLHVNVCVKNPNRPRLAWSNPEATTRGHDAILREQVEILKRELHTAKADNFELSQKMKSVGSGVFSTNLEVVGSGKRTDIALDQVDFYFESIGDAARKKEILDAWQAGWTETKIMSHFKITAGQLCLLVAYAKTSNACPPAPVAPAPEGPQQEFNDHPVFGLLRTMDDGVNLNKMAECLRNWKETGEPITVVARRFGFLVETVAKYFNVVRSESCTHFKTKAKHVPECFRV